MSECRKCAFPTTPEDPCLCDWEDMKTAAWRLGANVRRDAGDYPVENPLSDSWTPHLLAVYVGLKNPDLESELCDEFERGYFDLVALKLAHDYA